MNFRFAEVCEDMHEYCGANPGWPASWCNHADFGDHIRGKCPAMCGLCTSGTVCYALRCYFMTGEESFEYSGRQR